jgi:hypothetical protein
VNPEEKTTVIRNLNSNQSYEFQIQYWKDYSENNNKPNTIYQMIVWTQPQKENVILEPTWRSIVVRWKPIDHTRLLVKYIINSRDSMVTLSSQKPFIVIDDLLIGNTYTISITYLEAYLYNNLTYSRNIWMPVHEKTYEIPIINETNKVKIKLNGNKIHFSRNSKENEKVMIYCIFMGITRTAELNHYTNKITISNLEEDEEYYIKINYYIFDNSNSEWTLIFVEQQEIKTENINEIIKDIDYNYTLSNHTFINLDNKTRQIQTTFRFKTFYWDSVSIAYFVFGMIILSMTIFLIITLHWIKSQTDYLRRFYQLEPQGVRMNLMSVV